MTNKRSVSVNVAWIIVTGSLVSIIIGTLLWFLISAYESRSFENLSLGQLIIQYQPGQENFIILSIFENPSDSPIILNEFKVQLDALISEDCIITSPMMVALNNNFFIHDESVSGREFHGSIQWANDSLKPESKIRVFGTYRSECWSRSLYLKFQSAIALEPNSICEVYLAVPRLIRVLPPESEHVKPDSVSVVRLPLTESAAIKHIVEVSVVTSDGFIAGISKKFHPNELQNK